MKTTLRKVRKSVRSKSGKTFQRSYMVKAQAPKKGRVLASFNHPGPNAGSDHSWLAIKTGQYKNILSVNLTNASTTYNSNRPYSVAGGFDRTAAQVRQNMGRMAVDRANTARLPEGLAYPSRFARVWQREDRQSNLASAFGVSLGDVERRRGPGSFG